jgi:hypothetical protein
MMSLSIYSPGSHPIKLSIIMFILWLAALMGEAPLVQAQEAHQVKAAILYNFAKFVEWPPGTFADDRAAITVCLFDRDPLAGAMAALQGKVVQGRTLLVRRVRSIGELKGCQIFFASASEKAELAQAATVLRDSAVLTVTDTVDNFANLGVIINLIPVEDKIRFEISMRNARQSRLKISSQLLKLANSVGD